MVAAVMAVAVAGQGMAVLAVQVGQMLERMVVEWCRAIVAGNGQIRAQQSTKMCLYMWSMGKTMVVVRTVAGDVDNDI